MQSLQAHKCCNRLCHFEMTENEVNTESQNLGKNQTRNKGIQILIWIMSLESLFSQPEVASFLEFLVAQNSESYKLFFFFTKIPELGCG